MKFFLCFTILLFSIHVIFGMAFGGHVAFISTYPLALASRHTLCSKHSTNLFFDICIQWNTNLCVDMSCSNSFGWFIFIIADWNEYLVNAEQHKIVCKQSVIYTKESYHLGRCDAKKSNNKNADFSFATFLHLTRKKQNNKIKFRGIITKYFHSETWHYWNGLQPLYVARWWECE